jgi:serine/threonine protein kinase/Tfp pilus assembly protein PilF
MNESPHRQVAIFTEAIQLPAEERAAFLDRACGGNVKLRQRVEALLLTHESVGDFLEESPQKAAAEVRSGSVAGEKAGDWIGRYKLLQQIGEGGWGVVYLAEQKQPVHRRVALKIIKPGMDTKNVIARFEAERQALALMDHPNIAQVYDAGATQSGRPYFVMQLVRGVKITEYCDQHSLPTNERLKLFVQVCHAIHHAHQKGIIHRDIKPSNILVTATLQGEAMPVVIDFGIAKATTSQQLTDKTLFTAFDMLIGTPAYMSPEQAALTSVDVDTRTDIYSLGVLLYELLTGSTPFDACELLKTGLDEVRRVIREQEPARPSTRLSKLTAADLTTVAQHRQAEPPALIRAVCGDLDWIAMKALEKDRTRRYETAYGMSLDVQRYLANEPISARPPNKLYQLQKMVLRNKLLFTGLGVIASLLILGLIIVSSSWAKERQARREADAALRQAEADKSKALTAAVKSEQVTKFLENMLQGVGPAVAKGQDTTMLQCILDRTAKSVGDELTNQPAVEAELTSLIGDVYFQLGDYDKAGKMHQSALAINRQLFGPNSRETAASLNDLGLAFFRGGNLTDAAAALGEALRIRQGLFGRENVEVAASLNDLASVYRHQKKLGEAETLTRESLAIREKRFGAESLEVADTLHNLSVVLGDENKKDEAEVTARKMLAMRRQLLGPEDPQVASALADVAWAANASGKLDEAVSLERDALAMQRRLLGDNAPDVAKSSNFLGQLLARQGHLEEARDVLQSALSKQDNRFGEGNPITLDTLRSLGLVLQSAGDFAGAEAAHRKAIGLWRQRGESDTPQALSEVESLAHVFMAEKKFDEAGRLLDESLTPALVGQPASADLLALRADLEARRGQWPEAANDAWLAFDRQPLKDERYSMVAALVLKAQNYPAYEQVRQKLLTLYPNTTNVFAADQVAKACLFMAPSGADLPLISRLADLTVTRGAGNEGAMPFFEICKALSEYRQGHFVEAAEWAQKSVDSPSWEAHAHALAVLAMADWQLGKKDEARASLTKGIVLAPVILPATVAASPGNEWLAWLFARVQLDEAAELIRP